MDEKQQQPQDGGGLCPTAPPEVKFHVLPSSTLAHVYDPSSSASGSGQDPSNSHLLQPPPSRFGDYGATFDLSPAYQVHPYFGYPFQHHQPQQASSATDFAAAAAAAAAIDGTASVSNAPYPAPAFFSSSYATTLPYPNGLGVISTDHNPLLPVHDVFGGVRSDLSTLDDAWHFKVASSQDFSGNSSSVASSPESTPDNGGKENGLAGSSSAAAVPFYHTMKPSDVMGQHGSLLLQHSPFETFCTVPGRTSLLSSTTKYKVTVGEIQRRISPPECLNASLLGGILRKAKSKDGGKALRESLKRIGLTLPAGRRKSANVTAWTALVEEEAVHMAKDFHTSCERDFPAKEVAVFLCRNVATEEDAYRRRAMLHYVRMFIKEISDLMNSDRSPICGNRPEIILDPVIQKPLTHFSMVTHGFGGLALVAVLDALNSTVHESFKHIDRIFTTSAHPFSSTTAATGANGNGAVHGGGFGAK